MYEQLYETIPDIHTYLERINITLPPKPSKEYLDQLIYAHQSSIPFENLDVCLYKKEIELGISSLFKKIVLNKRGGYCFELNNLFLALLKSLNYDAYACLVKVIGKNELNVPALHRGSIVKFEDGLYYCDVGFGGPVPGGAMKLEDNTTQLIHGEKFKFVKSEDNWWVMYRINGLDKEEEMLLISPVQHKLEDFVALSHYCSCHSQREFNHFTDNIIANIRVKNGHYSLMNDTLTIKINESKTIIQINSDLERQQILKEYFLLQL